MATSFDFDLYNALFYVNDQYGFRFATATGLDHGANIIQQADGATRTGAVWFSKVVTSSSFEVDLTWASRSGRDDFLTWVEKYSLALTDPNSNVPMMNIYISQPEEMENFWKVGVPTSGMNYDYVAGTAAYTLSLGFTGTSNAIFKSLQTRKPGDPVLEILYPGGYDVGQETPQPSLYDLPSELEMQQGLGQQSAWFSSRRIASQE